MSPELVFRADGGPKIGGGHLMRCLALAEAWVDRGGRVGLVSRALPESFRSRWEAEGARIVDLPEGLSEAGDASLSAEAAPEGLLAVDHYGLGLDWRQGVRAAGQELLWIDDLGAAAPFGARWILNPSVHGSPAFYEGFPGEVWGGVRFGLLRRGFRRPPPQRPKDPLRRLLITMGAADPDGVTGLVLDALEEAGVRAQRVVVVGGTNPRREALVARGAREGHEVLVDVADMVGLFDGVDGAISACGGTGAELAARGVPAVLMPIADNQEPLARAWGAQDLAVILRPEDPDLGPKLGRWCSDPGRLERADRGMALVDGRGAERVVDGLARGRLVAREAKGDDAERLFGWANDPEARAWSFSKGAIAWESHLAWFGRRLANPLAQSFIVEDPFGAAVGLVRFDLSEGFRTVSIQVDSAFRGRGYAVSLLETATARVGAMDPVTPLLAWVQPDNTASVALFRRAGYEERGTGSVSGVPALRFERRP